MPGLENKLRAQALSRGFSSKNNLGVMQGSKETAKGKPMQAKHERTVKLADLMK